MDEILFNACLNKNDKTWEELGSEFGLTGHALRCRYLRARKEQQKNQQIQSTQQTPQHETYEIKQDGSIVSEKLLQAFLLKDKTTKHLIELHGIDPELFELVSYRSNVWQSNAGEGKTIPLIQSKVVVKPKQFQLTSDQIFDVFQKIENKSKSWRTFHSKAPSSNSKLALISIADLHLNKLSDIDGEEYNIEIAAKRFIYTIDKFIEKIQREDDVSKIIFHWSNDFFNSDLIDGSTTKGTRQDNQVSWHKIFEIGMTLLTSAINHIAESFPNTEIYTLYTSSSNHDKQVGFYAAQFLSAYYRNTDGIFVDNVYCPRKYLRFGNTLLGFSHGDDDAKKLPMLMSIESKEWSDTLYHYFFVGHLHSEHQKVEANGVVIHRLSSPTGTDDWHKTNGYVGAIKSSQGFIFDFEYGLENIFYVNIPKEL